MKVDSIYLLCKNNFVITFNFIKKEGEESVKFKG